MEKLETVSDFILGGSKITADDDCSHEIKRRLLLERKALTNLNSKPTDVLVTLRTCNIAPFPNSRPQRWLVQDG